MRTGDIKQDASIENCLQNLNLSSCDGLQTFSGNDLLRQHGPQTLSQAFNFFGRVVKIQAEGKTSMKRAVQQTLIEFTKTSVLNRGISEYSFSYPALMITVKTLGLVPWPLVVMEADPGTLPSALEQ